MMKYLQNCNRNGVQGFLKCVWELFNGLPDLLKARKKILEKKRLDNYFSKTTPQRCCKRVFKLVRPLFNGSHKKTHKGTDWLTPKWVKRGITFVWKIVFLGLTDFKLNINIFQYIKVYDKISAKQPQNGVTGMFN